MEMGQSTFPVSHSLYLSYRQRQFSVALGAPAPNTDLAVVAFKVIISVHGYHPHDVLTALKECTPQWA